MTQAVPSASRDSDRPLLSYRLKFNRHGIPLLNTDEHSMRGKLNGDPIRGAAINGISFNRQGFGILAGPVKKNGSSVKLLKSAAAIEVCCDKKGCPRKRKWFSITFTGTGIEVASLPEKKRR